MMKQEIITYQELIERADTCFVAYSDLLLTKEWQDRRAEIIKRDNNRCAKCGKQETIEDTDDYGRRTYHFWYGKERTVYTDFKNGTYDSIPQLIYSDKPYWMEVHHRYYVLNKLPWEYDEKALITLCNWCHRELHQNETINVYPSDYDHNTLIDLEPCNRCGGEGWFPEYEHVDNGICFRCRGTKYDLPLIKIEKADHANPDIRT